MAKHLDSTSPCFVSEECMDEGEAEESMDEDEVAKESDGGVDSDEA